MAVMFNPLAYGGGLDRLAVTGPTGVGNGSNPDGPWLPENLGSMIQIDGSQLEFGFETMVPKFRITDRFGRTIESKNVAHTLPYLCWAQRVDGDTVTGLKIRTEFGMGASFEKSFGRIDSRTLISGTYIEPYVTQRLNDQWSIGLGLIIADTMLTWHGPFDINRHNLPIETDTKAIGAGIGAAVGVFYQPNENWAFGMNYTSSIKARLNGRTEILSPFHLRDEIKADFQFPDELEVSGAWKATDRLLLVADWTWYGYSKSSLESVDIKFDKLTFTKPVKTGWADNWAARVGASYKVNDRLTIGGGTGYMSAAVPDQTADFMTPDTDGVFVAGRLNYQIAKSWDLTVGLSRGWGSNKADGREISADVWTGAISGTVKF
ncbi:MAG: outer membrane protein transport protein [Candidatus Buchananbacteria bacterium]